MSESPRSRILVVLTSAYKTLLGNEDPTGWYLPEAAHPYYVLSPHFPIDFASPDGPNPPLDLSSVKFANDDDESKRFLNDPAVKILLENAKHLSDVRSENYVAIFYVGGRGPVMDLPTDQTNIRLADEFYRSGKIVAAVCHGPAALVGVTEQDGTSIFKGKAVTGYSNAEEKKDGKLEALPFLLEDRVKSLGATYEKADELFAAKVVHSDNLSTGQNPASARPLAKDLLKKLQAPARVEKANC